MKAVTYTTFGNAADVLKMQDLPQPQAGPGEVLIELAFSGINPSDIKARAGGRPGIVKPPFPIVVPHSDGSGVITDVGDGVPRSRLGQRVWVWNGQWQRAFGTAATHIALPADQAVPLPETVSLETGAVLGIPGLTASHVVFSGGEIGGKTILIHGGAGTVGYLAVQLAKWAGARVIATASPGSFDRVTEAGADSVLDYRSTDLAAQILDANNGQAIERIVDVEFGANIETNTAVISENGRINAYGSAANMTPVLPFYPLLFKAVTVEIALVYLLSSQARSEATHLLHQALMSGALTCPVESILPLQNCADAHDLVAEGHRKGAVLLRTI